MNVSCVMNMTMSSTGTLPSVPHVNVPTLQLHIQQIVENCTELVELSLHMTKLCKKSVDILCSGLTSKIEKLDLFDMVFLSDNHVEKLVTRCNKIS